MKTALFLLPSLLVASLSAWMPSVVAASDTCNNVDITLTNSTPNEIKITKLEYYDFDKGQYRTETGVIGEIYLEIYHHIPRWAGDPPSSLLALSKLVYCQPNHPKPSRRMQPLL